MTVEKKIGDQGESIAQKFLQSKGLEFIERNFHAQGGEIDLIMKDPKSGEYIFVEVKTRTNKAFGDGAEAVTISKFEKILSAIEDYFLKKNMIQTIPFFRIDVVIVRIEGERFFCEHVPDISFESF